MPDHILSTQQFLDPQRLEELFGAADQLADANRLGTVEQSLIGKVVACIFYEPSTRTRLSFESAVLKLGGQVISTESAGHFSSAVKGETLEDTIRIISGYADAIVLRHPDSGAAQRAATVADVPIINAGDGDGEHPTQALLDLYTIRQELGRTDQLHIAMVGDLRYGRTVHSLLYLLSLSANIRISLISPEFLRLPQQYRDFLVARSVPTVEHQQLESVISDVDVLYMTRVQKERFSGPDAYEKVKDAFVLDQALLEQLPAQAVVMHPLPRITEITAAVDADQRAAYFRQARNGLPVRMALLQQLFG